MTDLFNFDDEFKLGIESSDVEHKMLIDMLNRTHDLLNAGKKEDAHTYFRETLSAYVHEHFDREEAFMASFKYPKLVEHKRVHANFRSSMERLMLQIETDDTAFRKALSDTYVWIISHIGKTDRRYADYYFAQQG